MTPSVVIQLGLWRLNADCQRHSTGRSDNLPTITVCMDESDVYVDQSKWALLVRLVAYSICNSAARLIFPARWVPGQFIITAQGECLQFELRFWPSTDEAHLSNMSLDTNAPWKYIPIGIATWKVKIFFCSNEVMYTLRASDWGDFGALAMLHCRSWISWRERHATSWS